MTSNDLYRFFMKNNPFGDEPVEAPDRQITLRASTGHSSFKHVTYMECETPLHVKYELIMSIQNDVNFISWDNAEDKIEANKIIKQYRLSKFIEDEEE